MLDTTTTTGYHDASMSSKGETEMSRTSRDELAKDGTILNGYDYTLQVWVKDGICQDVGLNSDKYAGMKVASIPGHEVR